MENPKNLTRAQLIARVENMDEQLKHIENILAGFFEEKETFEEWESKAFQYLMEYRPDLVAHIHDNLVKHAREKTNIAAVEDYLETADVYGSDSHIICHMKLSGNSYTVGFTQGKNINEDCLFIHNHDLPEPDYITISESQLLIQALHVAQTTLKDER